MNDGGHHDTRTTRVPGLDPPPHTATAVRAYRPTGRPLGSLTREYSPEVKADIVRRVRLRQALDEVHSNKAIARDYGITPGAVQGLIARLRMKGKL
jgi:transposase-like protein